MLRNLTAFDTELFRLINGHRSLFFDWFFSIFSAHITIGIVVTLITFWVMKKKNFKYWWMYIIVIGLCFLSADRISVICFKDVFCRLRPSHALSDAVTVKLRHYSYLVYDHKGGLYGFVSSHAANTFAIITALILIMRKEKAYWFYSLLILWGVLTGISRVYCGYHYPLDVFCGALLGIVLGFGVFLIYRTILKILRRKQTSL